MADMFRNEINFVFLMIFSIDISFCIFMTGIYNLKFNSALIGSYTKKCAKQMDRLILIEELPFFYKNTQILSFFE